MGWLAGWSNRKTVTITGQAGAGTNYQVKLSIGDASGGDFHLENHCTSFPNDIQVTDNDQTTPLDYWIEDLTIDPISMWVEVADSLDSNADVCVYYRKSGESSASNIGNTFLVGDDFGGNLSKWSIVSAVWAIETGELSGSDIIDVSDGHIVTDTYTIQTNFAIDTKIKLVTDHGGYIQFRYQDADNKYRADFRGATSDDVGFYKDIAGNWTDLGHSAITGPSTNTWYDVSLTVYSNTFTVTARGVSKEITDTSITNSGKVGLSIWQQHHTHFDNFRVRNFHDPEPAYLSASAEESAPAGAIINQFQKANLGADLFDGGLIT